MHIVVQVHHVFCVFQKQLDGRHDNGTVGMLQSVIQDILKTKSVKIPQMHKIFEVGRSFMHTIINYHQQILLPNTAQSYTVKWVRILTYF